MFKVKPCHSSIFKEVLLSLRLGGYQQFVINCWLGWTRVRQKCRVPNFTIKRSDSILVSEDRLLLAHFRMRNKYFCQVWNTFEIKWERKFLNCMLSNISEWNNSNVSGTILFLVNKVTSTTCYFNSTSSLSKLSDFAQLTINNLANFISQYLDALYYWVYYWKNFTDTVLRRFSWTFNHSVVDSSRTRVARFCVLRLDSGLSQFTWAGTWD